MTSFHNTCIVQNGRCLDHGVPVYVDGIDTHTDVAKTLLEGLCPICGSPTRRAFATTDNYVTCTRNGHVHRTT